MYCLFLQAAVIMCIFIINILGNTLHVVKWAVKWDGQIRKKFCLFYLAQWNRKNASVSGQEIKGKFSNLVRPVVTWYVFRDPGLVLVVRWSEIRDGIRDYSYEQDAGFVDFTMQDSEIVAQKNWYPVWKVSYIFKNVTKNCSHFNWPEMRTFFLYPVTCQFWPHPPNLLAVSLPSPAFITLHAQPKPLCYAGYVKRFFSANDSISCIENAQEAL